MAINKRQSGPWVKATVIIVTFAFVLSVGFGFITSLQGQKPAAKPGATGTGTYETVAAKYRPTVASNSAQLQADPKNYDVLVQQGNTYFDWANELSQKVNPSTTGANAQLVADVQALWITAADHYERAVAVKPGDSSVTVDYAIATFYAGNTDKAIKIAQGVTKKDAKFPQAWFNLGIFYERSGDNKSAIAAFNKFVQLKPKGQEQQLKFANERLNALRSQPASETTGAN